MTAAQWTKEAEGKNQQDFVISAMVQEALHQITRSEYKGSRQITLIIKPAQKESH